MLGIYLNINKAKNKSTIFKKTPLFQTMKQFQWLIILNLQGIFRHQK